MFFAQDFGAVELGDRGPAQFADLLRDLLGARLKLRGVEIPATQIDLAAAVFDVSCIVLGKALDVP